MDWIKKIIASIQVNPNIPINLKNVPSKILKSFQNKYSREIEVNWVFLKGNYIAIFHYEEHFYWLEYNLKGILLKEYRNEKIDFLPKKLVKKVLCNHVGYHLVQFMVDNNKKSPQYSMLLNKNNKNLSIEFDHKGDLINKLEL